MMRERGYGRIVGVEHSESIAFPLENVIINSDCEIVVSVQIERRGRATEICKASTHSQIFQYQTIFLHAVSFGLSYLKLSNSSFFFTLRSVP